VARDADIKIQRCGAAPALGCFCSLALAGAASAQGATCTLDAAGTGKVVAVRDGRKLMLKNGREVRLAAIEAPDQSRAALLRFGRGPHAAAGQARRHRSRRYSRLVAFAFVGDATQSLQQTLIGEGWARVSSRAGGNTCAADLLAAEKAARTVRRGLWADPNFAPLAAENTVRLRAESGHFVLVEGKVLSVRESGATIYVNFRRRWAESFSVTIPRRLGRSFAAAGMEPKRLEGRRVRVRGWLEQRTGPIIAADAPEQIEFVD
jgi:endonuclease YncB( thermonuclease family)